MAYNHKKEFFSRKLKENMGDTQYWKINMWDKDLYNNLVEAYKEDLYEYFNKYLDDYIDYLADKSAKDFWRSFLKNSDGGIAGNLAYLEGTYSSGVDYGNQEVSEKEVKDKINDLLKNRKNAGNETPRYYFDYFAKTALSELNIPLSLIKKY